MNNTGQSSLSELCPVRLEAYATFFIQQQSLEGVEKDSNQ